MSADKVREALEYACDYFNARPLLIAQHVAPMFIAALAEYDAARSAGVDYEAARDALLDCPSYRMSSATPEEHMSDARAIVDAALRAADGGKCERCGGEIHGARKRLHDAAIRGRKG